MRSQPGRSDEGAVASQNRAEKRSPTGASTSTHPVRCRRHVADRDEGRAGVTAGGGGRRARRRPDAPDRRNSCPLNDGAGLVVREDTRAGNSGAPSRGSFHRRVRAEPGSWGWDRWIHTPRARRRGLSIATSNIELNEAFAARVVRPCAGSVPPDGSSARRRDRARPSVRHTGAAGHTMINGLG